MLITHIIFSTSYLFILLRKVYMLYMLYIGLIYKQYNSLRPQQKTMLDYFLPLLPTMLAQLQSNIGSTAVACSCRDIFDF